MHWEGQTGGAGAVRGCLLPGVDGSVVGGKADELGLPYGCGCSFSTALLCWSKGARLSLLP